MKKIYFAPTAKVVELKAQAILAGSDPQITVDPNGEGSETMDSMRDIDFEDED